LTKKNNNSTKRIYYDENIMKEYRDIPLYGYNMRCMASAEECIKILYGKYAYSKMKIRPFIPTTPRIIDMDLSIRELQGLLDGVVSNEDSWINFRSSQKVNRIAKKLQKPFSASWNVILRTEARIKLKKRYLSIKKEILVAFNEKNYSKLDVLLREYDEQARWFAEKNLCLCFDSQIFDIYCEYLKYNNEERFAKKLKSLLPEEHYIILGEDFDSKMGDVYRH